MTIFLDPYITRLAWGLGLIYHYASMRRVGSMQSPRVTTFWAMRMIERRDTPHGMQFQVVHRFNFESSNDEESLPETTATIVHPIPAIALIIATDTPSLP